MFGREGVVNAMTLSGGGVGDTSGRGFDMARDEQATVSERQALSAHASSRIFILDRFGLSGIVGVGEVHGSRR